jgi:hypothetical protein
MATRPRLPRFRVLAKNPEDRMTPQDKANRMFKKEKQAVEGQKAMAEYLDRADKERVKMEKLKALRLARDAKDEKLEANGETKLEPNKLEKTAKLQTKPAAKPAKRTKAADARAAG